ncbi:MAG: hypothetical protein R3284_04685 [Rubricoccaceae bacterium]|nr:hypothetical protein [Rubricoccaceae bacterium]
MHRFVGILALAVLWGCGPNNDEPPPATPAEPEAASFAGSWSMEALPMEGDSVLVAFTMTATDSTSGWSITFDHLDEPVTAANVILDGESATVEMTPYPSALRDNSMVTTTSVFTVDGDAMTGQFTAEYDTGDPAVLEGRLRGVRQ